MNILFEIVGVEVRSQIRRPIYWIWFAVVSGLMLWETFPCEANFHRLTDLPNPVYTTARLVSLSTPLFALLAVILCTGRFSLSVTPEAGAVEWTCTGLRPWNYLLGKYLGNFIAVTTLPAGLCALSMFMRMVYTPDGFAVRPYMAAYTLLGLLPLGYMLALAMLAGVFAKPYFARVALLLYILWSEILALPDRNGANPIFRIAGDLYALVYPPSDPVIRGILQNSGMQSLWFEAAVIFLSLSIVWACLSAAQFQRNRGFRSAGRKG